MKVKKSWIEKLNDSKDLPRLITIPTDRERIWGKGRMVIPAPMEVNDIMKRVPKGKLITMNQVRKRLAQLHDATVTCPTSTGIFAWIAANASEERVQLGKKPIPYWRTLKEGGVINEKYPGGIENQAILLEEEGHTVVQKGKKWIVADLEESRMQM